MNTSYQSRAAAALLCLLIIFAASGCAPVSDSGITMEEIARANSFEAVFDQYSSLRNQAVWYGVLRPDGSAGDFAYTAVHVKGDGGVSYYYTDDEGGLAIEGRNVYYWDSDGGFGVYGFFDDGTYEAYYYPYISENAVFLYTEFEELVSSSLSNGVRTVVTRFPANQLPGSDYWGNLEGTVEYTYALDAESNLIQSVAGSLLTDGGQRTPLTLIELFYGMDDDFEEPEYVRLSKDMSETRTVSLVRDPNTPEEKIFTFTIARRAGLIPFTMEEYALFLDAELTIPHESVLGDFPDEITLYMGMVG